MSELSKSMYDHDIAVSARMRAFSRDNILIRPGLTGPYHSKRSIVWDLTLGAMFFLGIIGWAIVGLAQ